MTFSPITKDTFAGLAVVNVVAVLSTLALFSILVRIAYLAFCRFYLGNITQTREYVFFHTQLGYYAACLLIANMFSSAAGLMGLPYLIKRGITEDTTCTAQAMFMQFGNIATAYFTVSIAVHTFTSLVLRRRQSVIMYSTTIALGWTFAALIASLPLILPRPAGPIYGEYNLTCGVKAEYPTHQFLLHLLPIFIASVVSALLYSFIFLVLRGTLIIKGGVKLTLNPEDRWSSTGENYHRFIAGIARSMLWYPVAYVVLLVPYSITKLLILSGFEVRFQGLIFAYVCWFLLGVVNVLLLYNTFRMLYPAFDTKISTRQDVESFSTAEKIRRASYGASPDSTLGRKITDYQPSAQRGTPSYPEKIVTVPSFYSYPVSPHDDSVSPQPSFQASRSSFNQPIVSEFVRSESVSSVYTDNFTHVVRQPSSDSLASLPVPPRRARSPLSTRGPAVQGRNTSISSPTLLVPVEPNALSTRRVLTPLTSTSTRQQTGSVSSTELLNEISQWVAQQKPDGSMPRGLKDRPMLSAVQPTFPNPAVVSSRPRVNQSRDMSPPGSASSYSSTRSVALNYAGGNSSAVPMMGPPPAGRHHHKTPVPPRQGAF